MPVAAAAVLAFAVTLVLTPIIIIGFSRLGVFDHPNARSSHSRPTLRGGGLALASGAVIAVAVSSDITGPWRQALLLAVGLFALLGLLDDLFTISALIRLGLQSLIAMLTLPPLLSGINGPAPWQFVVAAGAFVWLVGFVNAYNFMDGINGIAVAQAIVAGTSFALVGWTRDLDALAAGGTIVCVAALAFAPFNFPKARVFLGDVGSYALGAWLAVLVVLGLRADVAFEALVAPLAIFGADAGATLVRRTARGATWYEAHREHTYQRLVGLGWSHTRTTGVAALLMTLCAALGTVSLHTSTSARVLADALIVAVVGAYLVAPSVLQRRRHQRLVV